MAGITDGSVYWVGADNNVYLKSPTNNWQVVNMGKLLNSQTMGFDAEKGSAQAGHVRDPGAGGSVLGTSDTYDPNSQYATYGSGSTSTGSAADERAAYDDQINAINKLLGYTQTQKDAGLSSLDAGLNDQLQQLYDKRTKTMNGYDQQSLENNQDKVKNVASVDDFANNSYNSLQRLLQGANASNSSVGKQLVPQLVSRSAGAKRQGVFDTAGKNEQSIASARGTAQDEYALSEQDLQNQKKSQEKSFLETILGKQNDLEAQRKDLEIKRAMANGTGYAAARAAGNASQASIDSRMAQLADLFNQYKPTYTARATNLTTPTLSQFTVDKTANISSNQNLPTDSSFYLTQLNKKKQLEQGF